MCAGGKVLCLHLKLLDIDHPLTFEVCKLGQIEAHALVYLSRQNEQHWYERLIGVLHVFENVQC